MIGRYQDDQPGPWETDEHGKRFRRVAPGCIEYPMSVETSYGTFEAGNVPAPPTPITKEDQKSWGDCPFNSTCSPNCARYTNGGCGIVTGAPPMTGRRCPFGDKRSLTTCKETCALWALCNKQKEE